MMFRKLFNIANFLLIASWSTSQRACPHDPSIFLIFNNNE
jgi:hypothetical protein